MHQLITACGKFSLTVTEPDGNFFSHGPTGESQLFPGFQVLAGDPPVVLRKHQEVPGDPVLSSSPVGDIIEFHAGLIIVKTAWTFWAFLEKAAKLRNLPPQDNWSRLEIETELSAELILKACGLHGEGLATDQFFESVTAKSPLAIELVQKMWTTAEFLAESQGKPVSVAAIG